MLGVETTPCRSTTLSRLAPISALGATPASPVVSRCLYSRGSRFTVFACFLWRVSFFGRRIPMFPVGRPSGGRDRDGIAALNQAEGPRDLWRPAEDRMAAAGDSFCLRASTDAAVGESSLKFWFQGVELELRGEPPPVMLEDYPSACDRPEEAATEPDRLSALGRIHWYPQECRPLDLRACPPQLIAKPDRTRLVHDRPNRAHCLGSVVVNPPTESGDMDGCLRMLTPRLFPSPGSVARAQRPSGCAPPGNATVRCVFTLALWLGPIAWSKRPLRKRGLAGGPVGAPFLSGYRFRG